MTRIEAQLQLTEVRLDLISSKTKLKNIIENSELTTFFEKVNSGTLIQQLSIIIDKINSIEMNFSRRFLNW